MTTTAPDQHHPALAEAPARLFQDPAVRSGIKFGTAAVLALFISELIRLESPQWSVITVIVLMPAQFTGAVAEKAFFRLLGTICGVVTGYIITASLEQNPILFLGMVTLSVAFGIMMFGQPRAPYAFFLFALTALTGRAEDPAFKFDGADFFLRSDKNGIRDYLTEGELHEGGIEVDVLSVRVGHFPEVAART